jgi:hypothetical protein
MPAFSDEESDTATRFIDGAAPPARSKKMAKQLHAKVNAMEAEEKQKAGKSKAGVQKNDSKASKSGGNNNNKKGKNKKGSGGGGNSGNADSKGSKAVEQPRAGGNNSSGSSSSSSGKNSGADDSKGAGSNGGSNEAPGAAKRAMKKAMKKANKKKNKPQKKPKKGKGSQKQQPNKSEKTEQRLDKVEKLLENRLLEESIAIITPKMEGLHESWNALKAARKFNELAAKVKEVVVNWTSDPSLYAHLRPDTLTAEQVEEKMATVTNFFKETSPEDYRHVFPSRTQVHVRLLVDSDVLTFLTFLKNSDPTQYCEGLRIDRAIRKLGKGPKRDCNKKFQEAPLLQGAQAVAGEDQKEAA